jgi:hypothetical protein
LLHWCFGAHWLWVVSIFRIHGPKDPGGEE